MNHATAARLLRIASIAYLGVALVWLTISWAPIDLPGRLFYDVLDWPLDGEPSAFDRTTRWTGGVGAGLLAGFATVFLLVVAPAIARGERQVANGATVAVLVWFALDGAGSVASGVWTNALWNVPFALLLLIPLRLARGTAQPASVPPPSDHARVISSTGNMSSTRGASTSR